MTNMAAKSMNLKFMHSSNSRFATYEKWNGNSALTIVLNCSVNDEKFSKEKILFSNKYSDRILKKKRCSNFEKLFLNYTCISFGVMI